MYKIKLNTGDRDGWITICYGRRSDVDYQELEVCTFSAVNATKKYLYNIYDLIDANTVKVLAYLTATRKTRVILVEDDFFEKIKKLNDEQEVNVISSWNL